MRLTTRKFTGLGHAVSVLIREKAPISRESSMAVAHVYLKGGLIASRRTSCSLLPQRFGLVRWWLRQLVSINVHTIQLQVRKQERFIYVMQRGSPWKQIFRSDHDQHKKKDSLFQLLSERKNKNRRMPLATHICKRFLQPAVLQWVWY
jgi:hypothetical protein